jgi:hypothetical protein
MVFDHEAMDFQVEEILGKILSPIPTIIMWKLMDNVLDMDKKAPLMWVSLTTWKIPKMWVLVMILQAYRPKGMNSKKAPLMWVNVMI